MDKITKEIDLALKNTVHLLEGVSGERIRDEFIKGINTSKSVKYFLSLLDNYKLFDWIFKDMSPINKDFIESNDELLVITTLLKMVSYDTINKQLNALKYSANEIKSIVFMVAYSQIFSEENFYTLKKMHNISGLNSYSFLRFVEFLGGDVKLARNFIRFQLSITGDYVKERFGLKDGPELGAKIKELETQRFFGN